MWNEQRIRGKITFLKLILKELIVFYDKTNDGRYIKNSKTDTNFF